MIHNNKFEEFDAYLERYATENETALNYWGNCACADASNLIEQFTEEDWGELFNSLNNRSDLWKERLAECIWDVNESHQLRVLEELIHTNNDALFLSVIEAFSCSINSGSYKFDGEIKNAVGRWTFSKVKSGNTTVTIPFTFTE